MQVELEHAELRTQYDELLEQLKMTHAALAIIIEEQGGLVKIDRATLESYDLRTQMNIWQDASDDSYVIQVVAEVPGA